MAGRELASEPGLGCVRQPTGASRLRSQFEIAVISQPAYPRAAASSIEAPKKRAAEFLVTSTRLILNLYRGGQFLRVEEEIGP